MAQELSVLLQAEDQLSQKLKAAQGAAKNTGVSFTELKSALSLVEQGMQAGKAIYDVTIAKTVAYAEDVRDLSRAMGANTEQASQLLQVADNVQVNQETLGVAFRHLNNSGIQPNIANLAKLADQYTALPDSVGKAQFAATTFGQRSGPEMQKLLEQGSAAIREQASEAIASGKVMSGQAAEGAHKFQQATNDLGDALDGMAIGVSNRAIPSLTQLIQAETKAIGVQNLLNTAIDEGLITNQDAYNIQIKLQYGVTTQAAVTADLTKKIQDSQEAISAAAQVTVIHTQHIVEDRAALFLAKLTTDDFSSALQREDQALAHAAEGNHAAALALAEHNQKLVEAAAQLAVNAGLSGTISEAQKQYADVIKGTQADINKLNTEIAKYTGLQGDVVTITSKVTSTQNEYDLAVLKAAEAQKKFAEYTGDDAEKKLELAVVVDKANESVVKYGEGLGIARDVTLDYTAKIAADKDALAELNAKQAEAESQLAKTTGQFILQNLAMEAAPAAQLEIAHALGLIDDKSYNLALRVQGLTNDWDLNKNGMIDAGAEAAGLAGALHNTQMGVESAAGVLLPFTEHLSDAGQKAADARADIKDMGDAIDALHDKTINIEINTHHNDLFNGNNPATPRAAGGPVAAGVPYLVGELGPETFVPQQSGTIVPHSGSASRGQPLNFNFNIDARGAQMTAGEFRDVVQRALAEAGYRADQLSRMGAY